MPGPQSQPVARKGRRFVAGKTALRQAGLTSRQDMDGHWKQYHGGRVNDALTVEDQAGGERGGDAS